VIGEFEMNWYELGQLNWVANKGSERLGAGVIKPGVCRYCRTTWRHLTGRQATPGIGPVVWFDWMAVRDVGMGGLG